MTKTTTPRIDNFKKYQQGLAAEDFARNGSQHVYGAIDQLTNDLNIVEEAKGLKIGAFASWGGTKKAAQHYGDQFRKEMSSFKPGEAIDWYAPGFEGVDDADKAKVMGYFNVDETFGDIDKKLREANYHLSSPDDFTQEQVREALDTQEKYQKFSEAREFLTQSTIEKDVRPEAIEASRKRSIDVLVGRRIDITSEDIMPTSA